ncbi:MAG: hypothetical protein ACKPKO_51350, partial [Candidatus Fonsibacter sp.]
MKMCFLFVIAKGLLPNQSEIGTPANKSGYKFDIFECAPWNLFGFCEIYYILAKSSSGIIGS